MLGIIVFQVSSAWRVKTRSASDYFFQTSLIPISLISRLLLHVTNMLPPKTLFLAPWLLASWGEAVAASRPMECALPTWTVNDLSINFNFPGSQANFTLHNTATNKWEEISCALEFATLCEINGTPLDKGLYIHLQTKGPDVWVNVTSPYTCDGRTGHVTGSGERSYECAENDDYKCTAEQILVDVEFEDW
ncbi:hypothetical protein B0H63DRAFT_508373 [Podospora didyma]|uniref:Uncharacterized protein n=1 Tax=Podospora didyma TaxID=330526 RepID=A0AAE0P0T0_9PEZI|nr:hypothetical protein B0H63DRAFT_508373 [Podospora didyma]